MKKLLFLLALIAVSFSAFSQTSTDTITLPNGQKIIPQNPNSYPFATYNDSLKVVSHNVVINGKRKNLQLSVGDIKNAAVISLNGAVSTLNTAINNEANTRAAADATINTTLATKADSAIVWKKTGNGGTTSNDFIGTTDSSNIVFKTNAKKAIQLNVLDNSLTFYSKNGMYSSSIKTDDNFTTTYANSARTVFTGGTRNLILNGIPSNGLGYINDYLHSDKPNFSLSAGHTGKFGFQTYGSTSAFGAIGERHYDNNRSGIDFFSRKSGVDYIAMRTDSSGRLEIGVGAPDDPLKINNISNITAVPSSFLSASQSGYVRNVTPSLLGYSIPFSTSLSSGFGSSTIHLAETSNMLWQATKRFTVTGGAEGMFDGNFNSNIPVNAGDSIVISFPNVTHPQGTISIHYYYTSYPTTPPTVSGAYSALGTIYNFSYAADLSTSSNYRVHSYSVNGNNYLNKIVIGGFSSTCNIAEIVYTPDRFTGGVLQETPHFNKNTDNNYYNTLYFNTTLQNRNHQISAQGNTYFNAILGNHGIGTTTPSEKLEVAGNIKVSGGKFTGQITSGATGSDPISVTQADNTYAKKFAEGYIGTAISVTAGETVYTDVTVTGISATDQILLTSTIENPRILTRATFWAGNTIRIGVTNLDTGTYSFNSTAFRYMILR